MKLSQQLEQLKHRVEHSLAQFASGKPILIGDDGKRENEVDIVFHASFATKELVNLALTHAKGLLCVALDHHIADKLGFYTAPRFPGGISHTNFTLSVDAKHGITSGISAQDRAYTIRLMASPNAQANDFLTPGHVFPLRAVEGGLLARAGHTEAVFELCQLSHLPQAGAMCEVLDEAGEPISPQDIQKNPIFSQFPFLTTVDLLWYKVFFQKDLKTYFKETDEKNKYISINHKENFLHLPCGIQFLSSEFHPENVRIVLHNGFSQSDNGVSRENACLEIILFSFEKLQEVCPKTVEEFCDMSGKIGLQSTKTAIKRVVTCTRALEFAATKAQITLSKEMMSRIPFIGEDKDLALCFR
jgi:3,4-dihydroxy 2-butanone 4-phosphate synthase/GTP cyclohydrolase II